MARRAAGPGGLGSNGRCGTRARRTRLLRLAGEVALDIAAWLRALGLEGCEQAFRDHAVDLDVLSELSEADLAELGVPPGHREKLLEAITELATLDQAAAGVDGPPPGALGSGAERRQLTVMLCELAGPAEGPAKLDPEVLGELMLTYHRRCTEVLARWDGHVATVMGDEVLAYFGWPRAHEDDAERAVRAGLELVEGVSALAAAAAGGPEQQPPLAVRVGIATGIVVVGDVVRGGAALEGVVIGETPNLAARLRELAQPGAAWRGGDCSDHAAAGRRAVRAGQPGSEASQGLCRAAQRLPGRGRGPRRGAVRGVARRTVDAAGRARA
jgi:class 3 adenylate cyclase